jgi:hypothetical protein
MIIASIALTSPVSTVNIPCRARMLSATQHVEGEPLWLTFSCEENEPIGEATFIVTDNGSNVEPGDAFIAVATLPRQGMYYVFERPATLHAGDAINLRNVTGWTLPVVKRALRKNRNNYEAALEWLRHHV